MRMGTAGTTPVVFFFSGLDFSAKELAHITWVCYNLKVVKITYTVAFEGA